MYTTMFYYSAFYLLSCSNCACIDLVTNVDIYIDFIITNTCNLVDEDLKYNIESLNSIFCKVHVARFNEFRF